MSHSILIIDDDEALRELLEDVLARTGNHIYLAEDGDIGLRIIDQHAIDLVITDIYMPNTDGLEVTSKLRRSHPKMKIIVMSGKAPDFSMDSALMLGAHESLKKPFPISELETKISGLLTSSAF